MKNNLLYYRKKHKLTQEELAHAVGVTRNTIWAVENQKAIPAVDIALRIAKLFDVKIEDLFELEEH